MLGDLKFKYLKYIIILHILQSCKIKFCSLLLGIQILILKLYLDIENKRSFDLCISIPGYFVSSQAPRVTNFIDDFQKRGSNYKHFYLTAKDVHGPSNKIPQIIIFFTVVTFRFIYLYLKSFNPILKSTHNTHLKGSSGD